MTKVWILERGYESGDPFIVGVFSSKEKACSHITGDDIDYERGSDFEEYWETSDGEWGLACAILD